MAQTTENSMDAVNPADRKKKLRHEKFGTKIEDMTPLERSQAVTGYDLRRRIEALVAGVTGKKIKTHFHGTGACTGEDIMILPSIPQTHLFLRSEAMTLLGYAAHEISHQLETDFGMIVNIFQDINNPTKKEKQLKEWWNAIEDYRIEKITRREYPGFPIYIGVTRHYTADRFIQLVKEGLFPSQELGNPYRIGAVGLTWVGAILNGYPTKANEEALRLLDDPLENWLRAMSNRLKVVESRDDAMNLAREIVDELEQNQKSEDEEDQNDQNSSNEDSSDEQDQSSRSGQNPENKNNEKKTDQKSKLSDCDAAGNDSSEDEKSAEDQDLNDDSNDDSGDDSSSNETEEKTEEDSQGNSSDEESGDSSDHDSDEDGNDSSGRDPEENESDTEGSEGEGKESEEKADDSNSSQTNKNDSGNSDDSNDSDSNSKNNSANSNSEDNSESDESGEDGDTNADSDDGSAEDFRNHSANSDDDSDDDSGDEQPPNTTNGKDKEESKGKNRAQNKDQKPSAGNNAPTPQTTQDQADAEPEESDLSIEEILEALSKLATRIDNAPTDIHDDVCGSESETVKRSQKKYAEIKRTLGSPAARSAGIVRRLLIAKNQTRTRRNLEQGRLDIKRLVPIANGSPNVYYEKSSRKDVNSAVSILVDNSGSMSGEPLRICQKAAIVLDAAIQGSGTDLEIMGFTGTSHNPVIYQYRKFGQKGQASAASLGTMDEINLGGTPVAIPILEAHRRLMAHKAPRKILIVISDGAAEDQARAKEAHDIAIATGCLVFGVGIGSWAQGISGWCDNHQMIQDINDLPGALSVIVQTALNGNKRKAA